MTPLQNDDTPGTILLIGASRGLGLAKADALAGRGWTVVATVRGTAATGLHDLAAQHGPRIAIEQVDITRPDELAALRDRLAGRTFDMLFVNAGIANMQDETAALIATETFERVMVTNALGPMRAIAALQDLVRADGLIGVMSSGQGSIANNTNGRHEIYRASKAALNQMMRSYAARGGGDRRALLLMAPGWIRTDMGGPDAPVGVEEAIPMIVDVLLGAAGAPGLRYLDRYGNDVPW